MWVRQRKKGGDKREKGKDVFTYLGGGGGESTLWSTESTKAGGSWLQEEEKHIHQAEKKLHMQN